jgi:hypothetical protein
MAFAPTFLGKRMYFIKTKNAIDEFLGVTIASAARIGLSAAQV